MKIGTFTKDGTTYIGRIFGREWRGMSVTLTEVPEKKGNGPDYVAFAHDDAGAFEIGAAWRKTSKAGKPYLSVKLDSPSLIAPINAAVVTQDDGSHALVWNRDARKDDEEQAAA
jgi:uncharacterized protein (DUF736 family)